MKSIQLIVPRVIDGVVRQPAEGAIPVPDAVADTLIEEKAAELVDDQDAEEDLDGKKPAELKKIAAEEGVDLGDAKAAPDMIAAIRAHRAAE